MTARIDVRASWQVTSHYNTYAGTQHWIVRRVFPNGTHIVLENDAGRPKRFRSEAAAWRAAEELNDASGVVRSKA